MSLEFPSVSQLAREFLWGVGLTAFGPERAQEESPGRHAPRMYTPYQVRPWGSQYGAERAMLRWHGVQLSPWPKGPYGQWAIPLVRRSTKRLRQWTKRGKLWSRILLPCLACWLFDLWLEWELTKFCVSWLWNFELDNRVDELKDRFHFRSRCSIYLHLPPPYDLWDRHKLGEKPSELTRATTRRSRFNAAHEVFVIDSTRNHVCFDLIRGWLLFIDAMPGIPLAPPNTHWTIDSMPELLPSEALSLSIQLPPDLSHWNFISAVLMLSSSIGDEIQASDLSCSELVTWSGTTPFSCSGYTSNFLQLFPCPNDHSSDFSKWGTSWRVSAFKSTSLKCTTFVIEFSTTLYTLFARQWTKVWIRK